MFYFLSKVLDIFLSPLSWGLALIVLAVPWRRRRPSRRSWRRRRVLGLAGLAVIMIAAMPPVANALQWHLEHGASSTLREGVTYDVVVLLGGVVDEEVTHESGQPSYNDNVERVIMTHRLLRDGRAKKVIVSGGTMDPKNADYGEAVQLARQLEDWGIARDRIMVESRSKNTRENALLTQTIAREQGFQNVVIVTSAFHMARAADCFRAVGMQVDLMPVDYRARTPTPTAGLFDWMPRASALYNTSAMLREWFGRWIYRVQGYGKGP
ncbi:MAG: YdcF family protein [Deltaproteobacteria bacterium]|nr:YdcF family protein [Deltaproteobacteria bacterium]